MKSTTNRVIAYWLVGWLAIHIGFVVIYQKLVMGNTQQKQKEAFYGSLPSKPRIWFMGDSHPLQALNPAYFPSAFNWGGSSENYALNYYKLRHLLSRGWKPETIFLSAEIHGLSAQGRWLLLNHELDDSYWNNKLDPGELDAVCGNHAFSRWWLAASFAPYAGQFYQLSRLWKKETQSIDSLGYMPSLGSWETEADAAGHLAQKVQSHVGKYKMIDSLQANYLLKIKDLCKAEGIRLVAIKYPVSAPYLSAVDRYTSISAIDSAYSQCLAGIPVLDFRKYFIRNPQYFSDPDHLNSTGARVFSRMLWQKTKGNH